MSAPRPPVQRGRTGRVALTVVTAVTLLVVVAGLASSGPSGGLVMAGLVVFAVGLGAVVVGRARWAFIASRAVGAGVVAAGLAVLTVGVAVAPPTGAASASTPLASAPSTTSAAAPSTADEDAAVAAAESAMATAESPGTPAPLDPASGLLADADAGSAVGSASPTTALAALAAVHVQGRAPRTGYDRALFGSGWVDTDRNGCDTRNDVLARDLTGETFKPGTRDCVVLTGTLADPYSGRTIAFQRGQGTSEAVQIDHVVALSDSWQKGAQSWDGARRAAFANDPLNLLAVDGPLNMAKGDGDAATWLPPNRGYRCAYVARQVAVKVSYGLWMTQAEWNASATVLSSCPDEPLPGGVTAVAAGPGGDDDGGCAPCACPGSCPRSSPPPGTGTCSGSGSCSGPRACSSPRACPGPRRGVGVLRQLRRGPRGWGGAAGHRQPGVPRGIGPGP